jgi:protein-S-isoprenylcysteine O-methyltransferase Ste14/predicted DCC family thiol-disulfide oxidoreductase YuxK
LVLVFAGPALLFWLEAALALTASRFAGPAWTAAGAVLFVLGGALGLASGLARAVQGGGTPLPSPGPHRLAIAGPYRYVRNPMVLAALVQGVAVGLVVGSPLVLLWVLAGLVLWNYVIRPREEADLERRFGDAYRLYRRRVRCWRPRRRGYDPAREADEPPLAAERTTPPGRYVVLYDGLCKFCTLGARQLSALARSGVIERVNFQEPGVLERFPGVSFEACMRQMYLVTPRGHVYGGFEAAVRALATRPVVGWVAYAYYLPGVRLACDLLYRLLAANRYRILGKAVAAGDCEGGTCALHLPRR